MGLFSIGNVAVLAQDSNNQTATTVYASQSHSKSDHHHSTRKPKHHSKHHSHHSHHCHKSKSKHGC